MLVRGALSSIVGPMHKALAFLAITVATAVTAGTSALPNPTVLSSQIDAEGARPVLNRLWKDDAAFDALCEAIATADPAWLEMARRLRTVSDAGASLSLNYSVARALPKAPERVLALIGSGFEIHDICTSPFIEPEPGVAEKYQKEAVAALKKVSAAALFDVRDRCLVSVSVPLKTP